MLYLSNSRNISILILINLLLLLIVILRFPNFVNDDYLIFTLISKRPHSLISTELKDYYYLFMRPVSYFSFWVDYSIWGQNAFGMKCMSILFHTAFAIVFYFLSIEVCSFFKLFPTKRIILFVTLLISLHPDNFKWIVYINNRTELLVVLFYALGLLSLLKYLNSEKGKPIQLLATFFFFVISSLSKEQSLHFPLIVLLILIYYRHQISNEKVFKLWILSIIGILLVSLILFIHYKIYADQTNLIFINIWKKPFSLIGTILCIVNPYGGELIYQYFMYHKWLAFAFSLLLGVIVGYFITRLYIDIKNILFILILLVVIFLPRIVAAGGSRLNSIQVLWFYILVMIVAQYLVHSSAIKIFLVLLLIANTVNLYINYTDEIKYELRRNDEVKRLAGLVDDKTFIAVSSDPPNLTYHLFWQIHNKFGMHKLNLSPFYYSEYAQYNSVKSVSKITCSITNDTITIKPLLANVHLSYIMNDNWFKEYIVIKSKVSSGRDYSLIKYILPFQYRNRKIIYYDGKEWQKLNRRIYE